MSEERSHLAQPVPRSFQGSRALVPGQDLPAMVELGWDLPPEELELTPDAGGGWVGLVGTYGRTGSTGSTVVTTSTLWERRHPLVMPTGRRGGPQHPTPEQGMLSPAQTRYSQRGQKDRDGLSRREAHEDPGEGEKTHWSHQDSHFPLSGPPPILVPSLSPPAPARGDISRGFNPLPPHSLGHP